MPDDLTNRGPQDRSRISLLEPHEVQYWADKFNVSKERLSEAVRNVGHSADAVERFAFEFASHTEAAAISIDPAACQADGSRPAPQFFARSFVLSMNTDET